MKTVFLFTFLFMASCSFGQLISGTLLDEGRKMISTSSFKLTDHNEGVLFYELAVDRKGNVTSVKMLPEGSTIISTPTRMKVRNHVMTFKFQEGTYYPEFHHVKVKITTVKQD